MTTRVSEWISVDMVRVRSWFGIGKEEGKRWLRWEYDQTWNGMKVNSSPYFSHTLSTWLISYIDIYRDRQRDISLDRNGNEGMILTGRGMTWCDIIMRWFVYNDDDGVFFRLLVSHTTTRRRFEEGIEREIQSFGEWIEFIHMQVWRENRYEDTKTNMMMI